jgi:small-conductance mechanosensitive channel
MAIIARLINENATLREPLMAVQAHMEKARDQLELAQRETARSLAQDAARNGVNLSVYLSRLERLDATLESARKLAELSSRYQEQVTAVEASIRDLDKAVRDQLQGYREKIGQLGEFDAAYLANALTVLEGRQLPPRERIVLELIERHVAEFGEQRRADPERWLAEFRERFKGFKDS